VTTPQNIGLHDLHARLGVGKTVAAHRAAALAAAGQDIGRAPAAWRSAAGPRRSQAAFAAACDVLRRLPRQVDWTPAPLARARRPPLRRMGPARRRWWEVGRAPGAALPDVDAMDTPINRLVRRRLPMACALWIKRYPRRHNFIRNAAVRCAEAGTSKSPYPHTIVPMTTSTSDSTAQWSDGAYTYDKTPTIPRTCGLESWRHAGRLKLREHRNDGHHSAAAREPLAEPLRLRLEDSQR
jgi:hypothetical protein